MTIDAASTGTGTSTGAGASDITSGAMSPSTSLRKSTSSILSPRAVSRPYHNHRDVSMVDVGEDTSQENPPMIQVLRHEIDIHVRELRQMYNTLDPAPFRERDIDAKAAEFIETYALDVEGDARIHLRIFTDQPTKSSEILDLREAVRFYYDCELASLRRDFRAIFAEGRMSLIFGGMVFVSCFLISFFAFPSASTDNRNWWEYALQQTLIVLAWIALWKPFETFMYKWWPLVSKRRLLMRIRDGDVDVVSPSIARSATVPADFVS
eukprot:ANDGO_02244.mRNA.1 hypothetical protein